MSAVKSGLIGAAAVGGVVAILFASGTVKLSGSDDEASADAGEDGASEKKGKKRRRKGKKGRKKGGKKGGNLESLGYIGAVEIDEKDKGKTGTTTHDASRAHQGLSLYNPCAWGRKFRKAAGGNVLREARIIDNAGTVLHAWSTTWVPDAKRGWAMTKLDGEGNLYAVNARSGFQKLDWESNTVWSIKKAFHHDFNFGADGNIYALVEHGKKVEHDGQTFSLLDNGIAIINPQGEVIKEVWLYDALGDMPEFVEHLERRLEKRPPKGGLAHDEDEDIDPNTDGRVLFGRDLFHANTLNFATSTIDGVWNEGDIITSIREMNMVVVLDKETFAPKWHWGADELDKQHDPEQLANGNVLVFDNGKKRHWSRVVEFDPRKDEVVWEYKNSEFFSNIRGLSQRLPNDGTLIVSSQRGRAFEVTKEGEIVWEYWSPDILRGSLRVPFRMERLEGEPLAFVQKQLDAGKGNPDGAKKGAVRGNPAPADGKGADAAEAKGADEAAAPKADAQQAAG
ncbi:MAG: aryl-sulfate sulfotransferase [Myxococcota bacterium]